MTPDQEASLTQGGDCFSHWHSEDRQPTQSFLHGTQQLAQQRSVSVDYSCLASDDYIVVDTSTGNVTITLYRAINGQEVEILKTASTYVITILPQGSDTVMGTTGVTISTSGAALRFKAFGSDWRLI